TSIVWRRFRRHRLALIGFVVITILAIVAIFAPIIGGYDPNHGNFLQVDQPPSLTHLLGTDGIGRDTWTRLLFGARVSLTVGVVAVSISVILATVLGAVSGFYGGWVELAVWRFTEIVIAFPAVVVIITLLGVL